MSLRVSRLLQIEPERDHGPRIFSNVQRVRASHRHTRLPVKRLSLAFPFSPFPSISFYPPPISIHLLLSPSVSFVPFVR